MAVEDQIMRFGKYKGRTLREILIDDASYLDWLAGLPDLRSPFREQLKEMCERYAPEIEQHLNEAGGRRGPRRDKLPGEVDDFRP